MIRRWYYEWAPPCAHPGSHPWALGWGCGARSYTDAHPVPRWEAPAASGDWERRAERLGTQDPSALTPPPHQPRLLREPSSPLGQSPRKRTAASFRGGARVGGGPANI